MTRSPGQGLTICFTVPSTVWFQLKLDIVNFTESLFNDNLNSSIKISKKIKANKK